MHQVSHGYRDTANFEPSNMKKLGDFLCSIGLSKNYAEKPVNFPYLVPHQQKIIHENKNYWKYLQELSCSDNVWSKMTNLECECFIFVY